jgi:hypothetical protein
MNISTDKQPATQRLLESYLDKANQLSADVHTLFGNDSAAAEAVKSLCRTHAEHWRALHENRGLFIPVLAFVGPAGAGKSSLINLLINRSEPELPANGGSAEKLQWIGPIPPAAMEPALEQFQRVSQDELPDLGQPFAILDTPGFGTTSPRLKEVMQRAFASTQFKVLVVESKKLGGERWREEMALGDGSVVLPVVHLSSEKTKQHRGAPISVEEKLRETVRRQLKQHMPTATLLDPVILPDFEATGDRENVERESRDLLISALRRMLGTSSTNGLDRVRELEASWPVFLYAVREIIDPLITERVQEHHAALDQVLSSMPELVVNQMLEDDRGLKALIRLDLRASLMDRIPGWAFPFRATAGLLCLTTGVWDRLVLAMAGSLPSTLLAIHGAAKGLKQERDAAVSHRDKVNATIERIVRNHISEPLRNFKAALAKHSDSGGYESGIRADFEIHGIAPLATSWQQALREATRVDPSKDRVWLIAVSLVAIAIFWLLLAGPLVHSYGQYIPAVFRSLTGSWDAIQLGTYPAMGGGFWLTAFVLSIIPVFIIALLVVGKSLSKAKVGACLQKFKSSMDEEVHGENIALEVVMRDSKINAYRRLLARLRSGGAQSRLANKFPNAS